MLDLNNKFGHVMAFSVKSIRRDEKRLWEDRYRIVVFSANDDDPYFIPMPPGLIFVLAD